MCSVAVGYLYFGESCCLHLHPAWYHNPEELDLNLYYYENLKSCNKIISFKHIKKDVWITRDHLVQQLVMKRMIKVWNLTGNMEFFTTTSKMAPDVTQSYIYTWFQRFSLAIKQPEHEAELTIHFHLMPKLKMHRGKCIFIAPCLHGMVLSWLSTGKTLPLSYLLCTVMCR
jgi:hypothetical protein